MPPRSRAVLAYEEAAPAPGGSRAAPAPRLAFDAVARLPEPHDNCAIARQDLPRGTALTQLPSGGSELTLSVAVLEGHRFALVPIAAGALLLSWGEPFGKALAPIAPGEWVRNAKALHELRRRAVDSAHGAHANFVDFTKQPTLTRDGFAPGVRRPLRPQLAPGFDGFVRPRATTRYGERCVGPGLHVMEAHDASGKRPMSWVETTVGLCGAGLHAVVAWRPAVCGAVTGHPMVPVLSVQLDDAGVAADVLLPAARPHEWLRVLLGQLAAVAGGELTPIALRSGNVDFQIPRDASACDMLSAETVNSVPDMLSAAEAALEEGRELPEVARLLFSLISAPQTRGSALDRGGVGTRMLAALCKLAALTVATQARAQAVALSALDLVLRPDDEGGSLSYVTDDPVATHTTAVVRALGKACAPPSPPAASELAVSLLRRLAGAQPEVLRASADAWLPQAVELALATGHMADALGPDPTPPADGGGGGSGGNGKDAGGSGGSGNDVAVSDADGDGADGSSSRAGGEARQRCESAVELLGSVLPWPEHAHAMPLSLCWAVWA
ncbi:hypothetical protein EMIHUDRAFT_122870, partial [Emiliania huxleyi CCMP1516]|uniref:SAF domain-containing protein n=2 Tax=Emiliania huxleyi TaxID=2903 RepID=A0A0D3KCR5_EMIH1